jgi:hypothetical protein
LQLQAGFPKQGVLNDMPKTVDSFRFINGITKRLIKNWIKIEQPRPQYRNVPG